MAEFDEMDDLFKRELAEIFKKALEIKNEVAKPRLKYNMVPASQWVNDEYYVGREGAYIYDFWKEQVIDIFETNRGKYNEVIITGALGCVSLDTLYSTSIGVVSLSEMLNMKARGEFTSVKVISDKGMVDVIDVNSVGFKKTKKITFSNGVYVEGTCDHRVKALVDGKIKWQRFDELTEKSLVLCSGRGTEFTGDTCDNSYFMGYLYGDGGVTHNHNKNDISIVYVMVEEGTEPVEELCKSAKSLGLKTIYTNKGDRRFVIYRGTNRDLIRRWEGIGNSHTKKIPSWFMKTDRESKSEFLRGLFDSDGSVTKTDIQITLCSECLIKQVRSLLFSMGIKSVYRERATRCGEYRGKAYRLTIQGKENWVKFQDRIGFTIGYKKNRLDNLCKITGKNDRVILYGLKNRIAMDLLDSPIVISKRLKSLRNLRYAKQNTTISELEILRHEFPEWVRNHGYVDYLLDNEVSVISPIFIEDGECECGDITVDGSVYIRDGLINHNTGKSTAANFMMARKLYELSCYENISGLFDLMPSSIIAFMYFNVSKTQAELTGYGQFKSYIDSIPYFRDRFPRNEKISSMLKFPENLLFMYGSSTSHMIGMNVIGTILDEANFFTRDAQSSDKTQNDYQKTARMYSAILNRSKSRFASKGKDDSLCILISSNTTTVSFTEQRIEKALKDGDNTHTKIINTRLWDVKPKGTYSDEVFWVFKGSNLLDPYIVHEVNDINQYLQSVNISDVDSRISSVDEAIKSLNRYHQEQFIAVPVDFRKAFEDDISLALQDIGGVSTSPTGRLFNSRPTYLEACDTDLVHPFYKDEIVIATGDNISVKSFLKKDYRPRDKDKKRYIHVDQSVTTDSTGYASAYVSDWIQTPEGVWLPIVTVDLKLRINPPVAPRKISIQKVVDFTFFMRDQWGLEIGKLTQDSYASAGALQIYDEAGIPCSLQSVDRTDEAYLMFTTMLYEGRIRTYRYGPEEEELFGLIHFKDRRKVDHPDSGSKDVMDAIVGAVFNAVEGSKDETPGGAYTRLSGIMVDSDEDDDDLFSMNELIGGNIDESVRVVKNSSWRKR